MKKFLITSCLFCFGYCLFAQDQNIETTIKKLEQAEVQAVLTKDTVSLKRLWDKDYIVNNPENKIIVATPNPVDPPVMQKVRLSFTRDVEKILINGDIAISMGSELVVAVGDGQTPGQTIKRRYTNIWMNKNGSWKLIARHANIICRVD